MFAPSWFHRCKLCVGMAMPILTAAGTAGANAHKKSKTLTDKHKIFMAISSEENSKSLLRHYLSP
jgi:hypothetical protein